MISRAQLIIREHGPKSWAEIVAILACSYAALLMGKSIEELKKIHIDQLNKGLPS